MASSKFTVDAGKPVTGLEALTLLFIGLKLTNHIDWEWWQVLSPLWIPLALACLIGGLYLAFKDK